MKQKLKLFRIIDGLSTQSGTDVKDALLKWNEFDTKHVAEGYRAIHPELKSIDQIEEIETPFDGKKYIHDDESFSEYCSEFLEQFCYELIGDERYTREIDPNNEDEDYIEGADFMYTNKGSNMVERLISRMYEIGIHYYPDGDINISSHAFRED